jgi:hypothetical protein
VHAASQPQSPFQSSPYERALLTSTPNPASWGYPDPSFGSEHPSGHDGTPSHLPAFPPSVTTGDIDDGKFAFHPNQPYAKPATAMNVDNASNGVGD